MHSALRVAIGYSLQIDVSKYQVAKRVFCLSCNGQLVVASFGNDSRCIEGHFLVVWAQYIADGELQLSASGIRTGSTVVCTAPEGDA